MAETKTVNTSVQTHGNKSNRRSQASIYVADQADWLGTGHSTTYSTSPSQSITLNFSFTRSSESSNQLTIHVDGELWRLCRYTSGSTNADYDSRTGNYGASTYGYYYKVYFGVSAKSSDPSDSDILGGWKLIVNKPNSPSQWTTDGYSSTVSDYTITWAKSSALYVYLKMDGGCRSDSSVHNCAEGMNFVAKVKSYAVPSYNAHKTPEIELSLPTSVAHSGWTSSGGSTGVYYKWSNGGDTDGHKVTITRGKAISSNTEETLYSYDGTSSGASGTITYNAPQTHTSTPDSDGYYSAPFADARYTIKGTIVDKADTDIEDTATMTRYIWGLPNITIQVSKAKVKGNGTENIVASWKTGTLQYDTGAEETIALYIDGNLVATWNGYSTEFENDGDYTFTPDKSGYKYPVTVTLKHSNSGEKLRKRVYFDTYVQPTISNLQSSTGSYYFSPQDTFKLEWESNSGAIVNASETPVQKITILNSNVTNSVLNYNTKQVTLSGGGTYGVQTIFNVNQRSNAYIDSKFTVMLYNTSTSTPYLEAVENVDFRVIYKPQKKPTNRVVLNPQLVDVKGQTVGIQDVPWIYLGWNYGDYYAGKAGVVNGYKVEIYYYDADRNRRIIRTTYHNVSNPIDDIKITIDTATDLKRGVLNYARITPYYIKPNGQFDTSNPDEDRIILGDLWVAAETIELVRPVYRLEQPTIDYPTNETTWHNKDFRILTTIPRDLDYDSYTEEQQENYTYGNIQVEVTTDNGEVKVYDYTNIWSKSNNEYPYCFSSLLTDYSENKAIWLNKVEGDLDTSTTYTFRVRVQKPNYEFTDAEMQDNSDEAMAWSPWSDPVMITIDPTPLQNLVKGNKIMAGEQNTVADYSLRLWECYPFVEMDTRNVISVRGDIIRRDEYQGIYETIKDIVTGVNDYCIYTNNEEEDRRDVQLAYGTKALPSFTAIQEIILAQESGVDEYGSEGRNYMNLLTRYMIECLK